MFSSKGLTRGRYQRHGIYQLSTSRKLVKELWPRSAPQYIVFVVYLHLIPYNIIALLELFSYVYQNFLVPCPAPRSATKLDTSSLRLTLPRLRFGKIRLRSVLPRKNVTHPGLIFDAPHPVIISVAPPRDIVSQLAVVSRAPGLVIFSLGFDMRKYGRYGSTQTAFGHLFLKYSVLKSL